ncbi:MAG: ATP-dependent DNA helicase RecG [Candidatus Staskawiczbacteria bacterium RIFCSPHIGHO2_02_FULL_34_10]|uniref:ATP-dependent DNA helicase RecG n=2 Tax=Candidatus Staskawicziibacteriota TaxID=1817916 RepID=A0A1G2HL84_9BACT|nr:MAG: ATP-dependent DNA helicase RecG [Candidatus Staskawiczbacteria bacterium RIFCSPHIGHO2_01_FULL_34_27]OGZ67196.1 MAG: ATP-dependent DNA helicase RecG [Candidatus Staskawiczbacteria bacterium RIFCSPHIGHO2_02_FULL_34_10]
MLDLSTKIEEVARIGTAYQKKLKKFGIKTVQDLLFYFPSRYDDFSDIIPIKKVKVGYTVCVQGKILQIESTRTFKKFMNITEIIVEDETGAIKALWFNQPYLAKTLKEDDFICLAGKVSLGKDGMYLNNPAYERISEAVENQNLTHTGRIVPVYAETRGLTSRWLRFIIKPLLVNFYHKIPEILPEEILKKYKFLPIKKAIWQAHFPDSFDYADAAKSRFSFEELFLLQLSVLKEKAKLIQNKAPACLMNTALMKEFTKSLSFELTDSQKQCSWQILKDLEKITPMSRLLEGDVGSGKTVVATMAALNTAKCGYQVAFMAPTEILANQHFKEVTRLLESFNVRIGFLTAKEGRIFKDKETYKTSKQSLLEDLKNGQIDILIGTHSLIQKGVDFKNLALVIVDEQHRFGVEQRKNLTHNNALFAHLLSMTATPIPRTLALTIYGDLDLSLIKEMPKNRKKVKTLIVEPKDRSSAYEFIRKEAQEGKGIFVICPKIEARDKKQGTKDKEGMYGSFVPKNYNLGSLVLQDVKAVKEEYEKLSNEVFPDLRITMLHGKMKSSEKEKIMQDFKKGEVDILVSTSVVEVGVDIPRATVMMIEGAERFGLAQLHQFRGRVGRSDAQSYCFLFTTSPDHLNRKRLKALVASNSGFELAQKDLEIRGPGQVYGTQQWGLPDIAMQGLSNIFLVEKTRAAAKELLEKDPGLKMYPLLKERLKNFEQRIHFE